MPYLWRGKCGDTILISPRSSELHRVPQPASHLARTWRKGVVPEMNMVSPHFLRMSLSPAVPCADLLR